MFIHTSISDFFSPYDRINYTDLAANNILASKVGSNSGSLWSNIATVNYPSGLAGPAGTYGINQR